MVGIIKPEEGESGRSESNGCFRIDCATLRVRLSNGFRTTVDFEPLGEAFVGGGGNRMSLAMIEEADPGSGWIEFPDGECGLDQGPAAISIGGTGAGLSSQNEEGTGGDKGEEFVVVAGKVGSADGVREVPGGVPVGGREGETSFAGDSGLDAIVKGGKVESFLGTERMADGSDPGTIHLREGFQNIDGSTGVVEHLCHSGGLGMASAVLFDSCVERGGILPEEAAGTEDDKPTAGELDAELHLFGAADACDFVDAGIGGLVEGDEGGKLATRSQLSGLQEVTFDEETGLAFVANQLTGDIGERFRIEDFEFDGKWRFRHGTEEVEPSGTKLRAAKLPSGEIRDGSSLGGDEQGREVAGIGERGRRESHFSEPGNIGGLGRTSDHQNPQRGEEECEGECGTRHGGESMNFYQEDIR